MRWVVDASVGIAWVHPGQATPEATALLHGSNEGLQLIVPLFWFTEMAIVIFQLNAPLWADQPLLRSPL
jgi:hypothetical protein